MVKILCSQFILTRQLQYHLCLPHKTVYNSFSSKESVYNLSMNGIHINLGIQLSKTSIIGFHSSRLLT